MRHAHRAFLLLALAPCLALAAQDPKPEITRAASAPQANGVVHTLRTIPEACARIEGQFTGQAGQAADPYKFALARTSANCQPRARLVSAEKVKPSTQDGWVFNDKIVVPSKSSASPSPRTPGARAAGSWRSCAPARTCRDRRPGR